MGRMSLLLGDIILCLALSLFDHVMGDVSTFFSIRTGGPFEYFYCLPQPYQTKVDPSWNIEENKVQFLRQESSSCRTETIQGGDATTGSSESSLVVADDFVFNGEDLERVSGAVALIQGSTCPFATWGYYIADYQLRVEKAVEAGATGVIFVEDSFESCIACWNGEIFLDREALAGKIAFFNFPYGIPGCFNYYYQWSILAQNVGAIGAVIGTSADHFYHVPGMYLVPEQLTIPFFTIMRMHAETISHLIVTDPEEVMVFLPGLVNRTGPTYFSDERDEMNSTLLEMWEETSTQTTMNCSAGQATYNPLTHEGVPCPDFELQIGLEAGLLAWAEPSQECNNRSTCAECLIQPAGHQLRATDGHSLTNNIIIIRELDFVCFHSFNEYTSAASAAGAYAVFIIDYEDHT
eukprot:gene6596-7896_t